MARYLFVSPHPDDAVFSAGGMIASLCRAGHEVAVATVFSRAEAAAEADGSARDREDVEATARVGAHRLALGFVDLPGRRATRGPMEGPTGADLALIDEVAAALRPLANGAITVGPLGVAVHPDHQIAFRACASLDGEVAFYEEVPYGLCPRATEARLASLASGTAAPAPTLAARAAAARWWMGRPVLGEVAPRPFVPLAAWLQAGRAPAAPAEPLSLVEERHEVADTMRAKMEAVARYGTQWPRFFRSLDEFRDALAAHARRLGSPVMVERLFRRRP